MSQENLAVSFDRYTELRAEPPTLIEGLPGHGLVAAIAADLIMRQLELDHHGSVVSEEFPPVASFRDGRFRDLVRVYAGEDPPVMTLHSDVALPNRASRALAQCVLEDLAQEFRRAVFLAGAPAESEAAIGEVYGVATTDAMETALDDAGVTLADGAGLVGGVTGTLVEHCYRAEVPATVLIVKANPYLPDPAAARSVIENALEPLVGFDIDTTELEAQSDQIKRQLEQIARQYRQSAQPAVEPEGEPTGPAMYQ